MERTRFAVKAVSMASAVMLCSLMVAPGAAAAVADAQPATEKSETVYMYTTADGTQKDSKVTATLKNESGAERLIDSSDLSAIESQDEGQAFEKNGHELIWSANGKDVTYSGKPTNEIPVSIAVSYTLDGAVISPSDLAGKSGKVTIRYDYVNTSTTTALVGGSFVDLHIPFTAITTLMFDGDDFKNVEVSNGRLVEDGAETIAVGYAMPGFADSLGNLSDDVDIPGYFELTADVTDFELKSALTMVSAGLFEGIDPADLDASEISDSSSSLAEATAGLVTATDGLASGLGELAENSGTLSSGAAQVSTGLKSASEKLPALIKNISALKKASESLAEGTGQLYEGVSSLGEAVSQAKALSEQAEEGLAAVAKTNATAAGYIQDVLDRGEVDEKDAKALSGALVLLKGSDQSVASQLKALSASASALAAGMEDASDALGSAESSESIVGGAYAVKEGADQISSGLEALESGSAPLESSMNALAAGASQVAYGAALLDEGAQAAAEGAGELADGMKTYRNEGINKIIDTIDNKLVGLSERMTALSAASDRYDTFSGLADGTKGSVKFVFETDAITGE